jgi:membrane protease YdiL (CAAX protease family)
MTDEGKDMSTPGTPVESKDRPPPEAQRQPDPAPAAVVARRPGVGPAWLRGILALPAFLVVGTAAAVPVVLMAALGPPSLAVVLVATAAQSAACIALTVVAWPLLCGAPLRALGLNGPKQVAARRFGAGVLAGAAVMVAIVGIGWLAGAWRLQLAIQHPLQLVAATAVLLVASLWEELGFRGVILQETGRRWLALGFGWSTVVFMLVHLANPGALDTVAARILVPVNIVLAGLALGAAFLLAGDLWWPWGLHFGWNWAQSCIVGFPVSGIRMPSLLQATLRDGRPWLTGSAFGPEASVIATAVQVAALAGLLVAIRRRRPVLPVVAFDRASLSGRGSPLAAAER